MVNNKAINIDKTLKEIIDFVDKTNGLVVLCEQNWCKIFSNFPKVLVIDDEKLFDILQYFHDTWIEMKKMYREEKFAFDKVIIIKDADNKIQLTLDTNNHILQFITDNNYKKVKEVGKNSKKIKFYGLG
jgi:hypothetical protein